MSNGVKWTKLPSIEYYLTRCSLLVLVNGGRSCAILEVDWEISTFFWMKSVPLRAVCGGVGRDVEGGLLLLFESFATPLLAYLSTMFWEWVKLAAQPLWLPVCVVLDVDERSLGI